jgi:hypothetical protein
MTTLLIVIGVIAGLAITAVFLARIVASLLRQIVYGPWRK